MTVFATHYLARCCDYDETPHILRLVVRLALMGIRCRARCRPPLVDGVTSGNHLCYS
jgi:hypothetical protein